MNQILDCGAKMEQLCCNEAEWKPTCKALYFCEVAVGKHPAGPYVCGRGGGGPGDPSKCSTDDSTLRQQASYALQMCENTLQKLYSLQGELVECAHDVAVCKTNLDHETDKAMNASRSIWKCQHTQSGGGGGDADGGVNSIHDEIVQIGCNNYAAIDALLQSFVLAEAACITSQLPKIPVPSITVPHVDVPGNIPLDSPDFKVNVKTPDFTSPDIGDIVVPGGGGRLDISSQTTITFDERKTAVQSEKMKCEDSKSTCLAAEQKSIDICKQKEQQKAQACEPSRVQLSENPNKDALRISVQSLQMLKSNPAFAQCVDFGAAINALIAALQECLADKFSAVLYN